jgi:hypothetical protein
LANKTRARGNWEKWRRDGRPTDEDVRKWRLAVVNDMTVLLDAARFKLRDLAKLLATGAKVERSYRNRTGLHPKVEAPGRDYNAALERADKLAREVELLYVLLEARSLGVIKRGGLVLGAKVSAPAHVRVKELGRVRADREKIEREMARIARTSPRLKRAASGSAVGSPAPSSAPASEPQPGRTAEGSPASTATGRRQD